MTAEYSTSDPAAFDPAAFDPAAPHTAPTVHWHNVGHCARPLHEQLSSLRDSAIWASVTRPDVPGLSQGSSGTVRTDFSLACVVAGSDYAALVVAGALDGAALALLRQHLHNLLGSGVRCIVLDLGDVGSYDGRLGALLARVDLRARTRGSDFVIANVPVELISSLDVGRLREALLSCESGTSTTPGGQTDFTTGR
ncbi:STAS domain-containing protein [Jatrophihabitans sp. DSM 45814]